MKWKIRKSGGKNGHERIGSKNGEKKQTWLDDESKRGGLQSEGVVQLEGTLAKIETKTKAHPKKHGLRQTVCCGKRTLSILI